MDEMQLVKDLRRSTPAITEDAEAIARTRLLATLIKVDAEPTHPRVRKLAWRTAVAGALAATVAVGFTVAQSIGGDHTSVADAAVVKVLDHASAAAAARPFTAPRPDQWIYQRVTDVNLPFGATSMAASHLSDTYSVWIRASGKLRYVADPGFHNKPKNVPYYRSFPPLDYATLSKLPTKPSALLAWLSANRPAGMSATDFQDLSAILEMVPVLPPKVVVAIYQAMKELPGVTIHRGVKDLRHRSAIGIVGRADISLNSVPMNEMVLLDPVTYAVLGTESIVSADVRIPGIPGKNSPAYIIKAGTVNTASVVLQTGIVDKVGQKP
jgi:hypothetical protein